MLRLGDGGKGNIQPQFPTPHHWLRQGLSTLLRGTSKLFTETEQYLLISPAIAGLWTVDPPIMSPLFKSPQLRVDPKQPPDKTRPGMINAGG